MAIALSTDKEQRQPELVKAWFEIDPRWIAAFWGMQTTGKDVRLVEKDGVRKIHVGVEVPRTTGGGIREGEVLTGMTNSIVVPTFVVPLSQVKQ